MEYDLWPTGGRESVFEHLHRKSPRWIHTQMPGDLEAGEFPRSFPYYEKPVLQDADQGLGLHLGPSFREAQAGKPLPSQKGVRV